MNEELKALGVTEDGFPVETVIPTALPADHEGRLNLTQKVRLKLVDALAPNGKVPTDKDEVKALLSTLKDMDAQELGVMRLKSDDNATAKDQLVAQAIMELAKRQGGGSAMRAERVFPERAAIPSDSDLPDISTVPGELDTGHHTISYKDLSNRFSRKALEEPES